MQNDLDEKQPQPARKTMGRKFLTAMEDAGIIERGRARRVIIDAHVDEILRIHVEYIGDDRILELVPQITTPIIRESREAAVEVTSTPDEGCWVMPMSSREFG